MAGVRKNNRIYYMESMRQQITASNNNLLLKDILERLRQIENQLNFINQYIIEKKKREDARWFF